MSGAVKKRIDAGIAYLDAVEPRWIKKIDLEEFNIQEGAHCVLGQTDSHYREHKDRLRMSDTTAFHLGFSAEDGINKENDAVWNYLNREWRKTLKKLLRRR